MTSTVTVIGLGPMGQSITRTLLSAGHEVNRPGSVGGLGSSSEETGSHACTEEI